MNRWLAFYLSAALAAAAFVASLLVYAYRDRLLPDPVPTHWNAANQADGFTPRDAILPQLLLLPGVMAGWTLLSLALPWLSPKPFSVDTFRGTYDYIVFLIAVMMGWIHASLLIGFTWAAPDLFIRMLLGGIFLFLALLGNVLGKVRRNFWIGVRTPWTLANETVWNQTHRLAAWTFTAGGLFACVAAVIYPIAGLVVGLAAIVAAALIPVIYSVVLYKRLEKEGKV
jgi:uncharacterized membrane protein